VRVPEQSGLSPWKLPARMVFFKVTTPRHQDTAAAASVRRVAGDVLLVIVALPMPWKKPL